MILYGILSNGVVKRMMNATQYSNAIKQFARDKMIDASVRDERQKGIFGIFSPTVVVNGGSSYVMVFVSSSTSTWNPRQDESGVSQ